jgi:GTP-binding nuclear protein Ran
MECASFTFKIIAAGDGGVGKTTMFRKYITGQFDFETKMTIGVEIFNKDHVIENGRIAALQLWDFGGQERFRFFLDNFVLGANGVFLMFD